VTEPITWEICILDAGLMVLEERRKIMQSKERIAKLEKSILFFKEQLKQGKPFPLTGGNQSS
jgi:hypothetical protein